MTDTPAPYQATPYQAILYLAAAFLTALTRLVAGLHAEGLLW